MLDGKGKRQVRKWGINSLATEKRVHLTQNDTQGGGETVGGNVWEKRFKLETLRRKSGTRELRHAPEICVGYPQMPENSYKACHSKLKNGLRPKEGKKKNH